MNFSSPRNLAIVNAFFSSSIAIITYSVFCFISEIEYSWLLLFFLFTSVFSFTFIILSLSLEKFIYKKIKIIYKTISSSKSNKKDKKQDFAFRKQTIDSVNNDVMLWAQEQKAEIEELKKLQTYRQEFIGNVSHELKTPIFNIQGYVLTLLDGGLDDPEINRKYLLRTEKSINRMIAIIEDLEAISRLESGELQLEYTKFDIIELTKEIIDLFEIKSEKKNIKISFLKNYDRHIYVNADKEKLRQVITNLIDNSLKYGNEGGETKLGFFDMDENILIEVADNGIGIEKNKIPRLFERFYRVDKSRSREQGGSGLGLSIVKHIIEAHSQTINVRSSEGIGTTFAFTIKKA